jgi:hypothetical protein
VNPDMLGPTMLGVSQAIGSFQAFLPKLSEIRKADPATQPEFAADVRMGEVAATAITMGVGLIVSSATKSPAPVTISFLMCLFLVFLFESTLRAERPMEKRVVNA